MAQHAASFDFDGDEISNMSEFLAQTNPGDPASYLRTTQTTFSGTTLTITFPSVSGRHHTIEGDNNLATWTTLDGPFAGTGGPIGRLLIFANRTPSRYFVRRDL